MDPHMSLEVEIKRKPLVAEIALVRFLACMNEHMTLEFGVVKKSFAAALISALKEFVAMDGIVFLQ